MRPAYVIWWQGHAGACCRRFAEARDVLAYLAGWIDNGGTVVSCSVETWQVA